MILLLSIVDLYMAPEVYKDEIFDRSIDAYSYGLILYEVHLFQPLSLLSYKLSNIVVAAPKYRPNLFQRGLIF